MLDLHAHIINPALFYDLVCIMYKLGSIPAFCKESNMVLLYKKAEPTRLENYRPIALAHTLSKLIKHHQAHVEG